MKKRMHLLVSICLFILSLTQKCYCTPGSCADSAATLLVGVFGVLVGGAAFAWLANPMLLISWISVKMKPFLSLGASVIAFVFALSFLFFSEVIEDEAGHYGEIVQYKAGYRLWLAGTAVMMIGNAVSYIKLRKETGPAAADL